MKKSQKSGFFAPLCIFKNVFRNPQFSDEVKMQLPIDLNDGHHLLFTFYHISCKASKSAEAIETPIGYTWHPLYIDGQLQTGDLMLPISLEPLPPSICYVSPLVNMPNIKWLENHKPLFSVHISPVSTVHAQVWIKGLKKIVKIRKK